MLHAPNGRNIFDYPAFLDTVFSAANIDKCVSWEDIDRYRIIIATSVCLKIFGCCATDSHADWWMLKVHGTVRNTIQVPSERCSYTDVRVLRGPMSSSRFGGG